MSKFRHLYRTRRWKLTRRRIFDRDGWRCVECGNPGALECDHKRKPRDVAQFFEAGNLRTLCRDCHIKRHRSDYAVPGRGEWLDWLDEVVAGLPAVPPKSP